jgi:2-keto-4-pentenoate hydratase
MGQDQHTELVDIVTRGFEARRDGTEFGLIPAEVSLEEAMPIQLAVAERFEHQLGQTIGGWKIGNTSGEVRDRMGKDFRPFGFILQDRIFASGEDVPFRPDMVCNIEPEICLVIGSELRGSDITPQQAKAAVRGAAPSFELLEDRVTASGDRANPTKIVDSLSNWGMVLGEVVPLDDLSEITTVELRRDGELIATAVENDNLIIDDIFLSLSRIVHLLDACGRGLEPGQAVLTGAFAKVPAGPPSSWHARFSGIGEVDVRLT